MALRQIFRLANGSSSTQKVKLCLKNASPLQTSILIIQQKRFVSQEMENAKKRVSQLTDDPGNEVKLKMYALFKQVSQPLKYKQAYYIKL